MALRVAVPAELARTPSTTGHGRMWSKVLAELASRVKLVERGRAGLPRRAPDVWLADGHHPLPPEVGGSPLVVQVHEASWRTPALRELLDERFAAMLDAAVGDALARADVTVTPSEAARREVADGYGIDASRIVVAHHGVDADVFRPGLALPDDLADGPPYVLFVGVLHPRKGITRLRDAVALLADQGLPHRLVVIGGAPGDRADPEVLARAATAEIPGARGRLLHRPGGDDAELAAVMANAAAFCLPSLHEGFGLPALEAMACGAPVVVSDRGALPEVVDDAGLVVAPEPDAIAAGLTRVLTDDALAADLRARGRERAVTMPWSRTADRWVEALELAVAAAGRG